MYRDLLSNRELYVSSFEDLQARAIASEWGVSVDLLESVDWELEPIEGNSGEVYGYLVRFDRETEPEILAQLGLSPGEATRQISANAFDGPQDGGFEVGGFGSASYSEIPILSPQDDEVDEGIYSIDQPLPDLSEVIEDEDEFPDLPPGQSYLTDDDGRILTDEQGRGLIADTPDTGAVGGAALNKYVINGPTYAGASFAGASFLTGRQLRNRNQNQEIEAFRAEMLSRLDALETLIRQEISVAPNRGHNRPPELLEIERPVTQAQLEEVSSAIAEIRKEADNVTPIPANVIAQVSVLRRIAASITSRSVEMAISGVVGGVSFATYETHKHGLYEAILIAADSVTAWVQVLASIL